MLPNGAKGTNLTPDLAPNGVLQKKMFVFSFINFFNFASYGARVHGSVFKMKFRVLFREFESIETSPGFA